MRNFGSEPSSVIFSQKMSCKHLKYDSQKIPEYVEANIEGVINPQNYNFTLKHGQFRCSQNATNQPKSTVALGYTCPRGPLVLSDSLNI